MPSTVWHFRSRIYLCGRCRLQIAHPALELDMELFPFSKAAKIYGLAKAFQLNNAAAFVTKDPLPCHLTCCCLGQVALLLSRSLYCHHVTLTGGGKPKHVLLDFGSMALLPFYVGNDFALFVATRIQRVRAKMIGLEWRDNSSFLLFDRRSTTTSSASSIQFNHSAIRIGWIGDFPPIHASLARSTS